MIEAIWKYRREGIFVAIIIGIFTGVVFAFRDYGRVNPLASFLGGMISGPLFIAFSYGFIICGAYATVFLQKQFRMEDVRSDTKLVLLMIGGFLLTAILMLPVYWVILKIPVVGDQLGFFFRDR